MSSSLRTMQQAINAFHSGHLDEGVRLMHIALRDDTLTGTLRATAYMWLAEAESDVQQKMQHYTDALTADPGNDLAQQRLAELMRPPAGQPAMFASDPANNPLIPPLPPTPVYQGRGNDSGGGQTVPANALPPSMPMSGTPTAFQPAPIAPAQPHGMAYHIVGIIGGPNGAGSGFFITRNGLLVTSRYVVGGLESVTVESDTGRQMQGRVVRSFPEIDLAFVYVDQTMSELLPVSPFPTIADNTPLTGIVHGGQVVNGTKRATQRTLAPHWFPTDIVSLPDAGGCPTFDDRHNLVGMLTRNISSSASYIYGVHINIIRGCVETFTNEMRAAQNRIYCQSCGFVSQAAGAGSYYCENCGTVMPFAQKTTRFLVPQMAAYYHERHPTPCSICGARAGFSRDKGLCLRCEGKGDPNFVYQ